VIGGDGVSFDMTTAEIEVLRGGTGNDVIAMGNSTEALMVSGRAVDDTITVSYGYGQGPRIIWGGMGDDVIDLTFDYTQYTGAQNANAGILVATVAGLTEANFAEFDVSLLELPSDFNWGKIDVVVLNPEAGDRIRIGGVEQRIGEQSYAHYNSCAEWENAELVWKDGALAGVNYIGDVNGGGDCCKL
jgi:hypothetical protein